MAQSIDLPENGLVALTRQSLLALRTALFRDVGPNAAALLQEAGYAGGQPLYDAFTRWLAGRNLPAPDSLAATDFALRATEFFRDTGWGAIEIGALESVATVDSPDWAESDPGYPLEFPGCYYTAGVLADFFGRLAGEPLAVMEVECRSMGASRCRFLVGTGEVLQRVYDAMGQGVPYDQAVAAT
ncbi:MAG TPA: V4R domain-containing protein [Gemmatimonadaceae bacterium]|nr:V4R domain-containing protein [Gemmatimonadaceae bacterium]